MQIHDEPRGLRRGRVEAVEGEGLGLAHAGGERLPLPQVLDVEDVGSEEAVGLEGGEPARGNAGRSVHGGVSERHPYSPRAPLESVDRLRREGRGGSGRVHVEEEPAAGPEGGSLGQDEEGNVTPRSGDRAGRRGARSQTERREVEGPASSREERLEGDRVQALLRRGEEGVGTPVGARGAESAAEPSPSDLGGLGPGEVDAHGEASREDESAARGVVAQGHQLESEGLVLTLEALAAEAGLHAREDAAGEAELGFAPARLHRAVPGDDGLRVADGGGDEAGEEAVLARLDGADAGLAAHDAVQARALQGQGGRERVGERVEAGEEGADAAGGVASGEEAPGLELDEGGARRAGKHAEGGGRGVAVDLTGVGSRGAKLGLRPRGTGGRSGAAAAGSRASAAAEPPPSAGGGAVAPACGTADTGPWKVETDFVSTSSRR